MSTPKNHGKPVTNADVNKVKDLANINTPTRVIGIKIGRSESSVYKIASDNNISLKPTNQSPYNRTKK